MNDGLVRILLVEDNPGDVRLTREALRDGKVLNEVHVVGDGEEALAFLRREGTFADRPRPGLVLLDLNLPRKDGMEVLSEVKEDPALRRIPVVVLTTSAAERDILRSYDLKANAYVTKPIRIVEFLEAVAAIRDFWVRIVQIPRP